MSALKILTVIIRDESPLRINEPCTYRTVHLELTPEQVASLAFRSKDEVIGQCFIEEQKK